MSPELRFSTSSADWSFSGPTASALGEPRLITVVPFIFCSDHGNRGHSAVVVLHTFTYKCTQVAKKCIFQAIYIQLYIHLHRNDACISTGTAAVHTFLAYKEGSGFFPIYESKSLYVVIWYHQGGRSISSRVNIHSPPTSGSQVRCEFTSS